MADKIVILEDNDGNNIYPITRGLAADSVDTNAIQDGAVTSSKIDSATITTDKIADSAITTNKIANNAIDRDKLANRAVTDDKKALPYMEIKGVAANIQTSKYYVSVAGSEAYSSATGWLYTRYKTTPIAFNIATNVNADISAFTIDDSDFTITYSGKVATVTYTRTWSHFVLEYPRFDNSIQLSITRTAPSS